jgi:hypothetical protein
VTGERGAPAENPAALHGADFSVPGFSGGAWVGEAGPFGFFESLDDVGPGAVAADDESVAELCASVDADIARPDCLAAQVVGVALSFNTGLRSQPKTMR